MLRVGVIFEGNLSDGGGYQTQISTLHDLKESQFADFLFFVFSKRNQKILQEYNIESQVIKNGFFSKLFKLLHRSSLLYDIFFKLGLLTPLEKILKRNKIALCYFLSPSLEATFLKKHNYIFTMWDTSHREFMEFPEVNFKGEFERREKFYSTVLKKAIAIIVDSNYAKENLKRYYGLNDNRIYPCSFAPSINSIKYKNEKDILKKYNIKKMQYIYYPAQFWSHKNHIYIVDALAILRKQGHEITAVFSGSDKGNLQYILQYAKNSNVEDLIKYIGFAPNDEIYSLYKNSIALVMPTYFGATNIPPLEAFTIGVPVIYSDLPDLREQTTNAALYCNLEDPNSLSNLILQLQENTPLREFLITQGYKRLEELQKITINIVLSEIIETYSIKYKTFQTRST